MKTPIAVLLGLLFLAEAAAKTERFDCGAFVITLDVTPEDWRVEAQPELSFMHVQKAGGVGLAGGTAFDGFVFVDRIPEALPADLEKWFGDYLKKTTGFLHTKVFNQPRSFRVAKPNPVVIAGRKFLRFDMVRRSLTRPASWTKVDEEGVVYFLLLPEFEQHKTFFVFTGRQVLSADLGQRSEFGVVEQMIAGFELTLKKKADQTPEPAPTSVTPRSTQESRPRRAWLILDVGQNRSPFSRLPQIPCQS